MRIALDAMGSDGAPGIEVAGALSALEQLSTDTVVLLVGDRDRVEAELVRRGSAPGRQIELVHAPDVVTATDSPAKALRQKPESSLVVGLRLQSEGAADAFVSAGSTGAVMATSLLLLKALPGVDRPAVATLLPTSATPVLMIDSGANVDCKPSHLVQFAHLGHIYAQDLMGLAEPRVGLLNIGEEERKGNEISIETHGLLSREDLNFVGNVEASEIIRGACDVLVCDGFAGNVLLKFYESVAGFIVSLLKRRIGDADAIDLDDIYRVLDYAEYGGAPLLGVNGVSIICHGKSPPRAIKNAIQMAARARRSGMVRHMARELANGRQTEATA